MVAHSFMFSFVLMVLYLYEVRTPSYKVVYNPEKHLPQIIVRQVVNQHSSCKRGPNLVARRYGICVTPGIKNPELSRLRSRREGREGKEGEGQLIAVFKTPGG